MSLIGIIMLAGSLLSIAGILYVLAREDYKQAAMHDELMKQHADINRRWDIILFHTRQLSVRFSEIHAESNRRWEELEKERRKE